MNYPITVEVTVRGDIEKVWQYWTQPAHIEKWNQASTDWECPNAENDLRAGGKFVATMAAKDGSFNFDFGGVYSEVISNKKIAYTLGDGRKVEVMFEPTDGGVHIVETFEMETENTREKQQQGWQAILESFKNHVEKN